MDPVGLLLWVSAIVFLLGEALALLDPRLGRTASERGRSWARSAPWRPVALGAGLLLLFTHIVYAWPW